MAQSKSHAKRQGVHSKANLIMVRVGVGITLFLLGLVIYFTL